MWDVSICTNDAKGGVLHTMGRDMDEKRRVMLRVSYDGRKYHGFAKMPDQVTVEGTLNTVISELTGEEIEVIGASRTDAGVHSLGNVAVFDTATRIPTEKLPYALNQRLPHDLVVWEATDVADDFHPRHCDSKKTYSYRILNTEFPVPIERYDTYHYYRPLDVAAMQKAADFLCGEHDFTSFASVYTQSEDHVRTIYSCDVKKEGALVTITVTGSGFLYNMVRIIAGTLIEVGIGKRTPESVTDIIEAKDRKAAGPTAPAVGLTMIGIEFL